MSYYWPSCVVAIGLRFDDAVHLATNRQALARGQPSRIQPGGQSLTDADFKKLLRGQRLVQDRPGTPAGPDTLDQVREGAPLVFGSPSDQLSWVLNVDPRSAMCRRPGYRRAGEAHLTVGFHELPVDPQLIKAAQIRVFFGTVDPSEAASGYTRSFIDQGRERRRSVISTHDQAGQPNLDRLALWGIADTWKVSYQEDSTVQITGRDLRSIFLESPLDRGVLARLRLEAPITEVIQQLCEAHPLAGKMNIRVQPADWSGPIPAPCAQGNVTRIHLGAAKGKAKLNPLSQPSQLKWWDAICQFSFLVGAVPYFRGADLIVRPARSLYDLRDKAIYDPRIRTPFANGAVRSREDFTRFAIRQMIVGHNLKSLEYERKFTGGFRPRVIEVICLDTASPRRGDQKLLIARWPEDLASRLSRQHATKESPSGQLAENEVYRVPVYGIRDLGQLREIARAVFETTARFEIEGSFQTSELASFLGSEILYEPFTAGNRDPDLLRLEPGDPIEFSISPDTLGTRRAGEQPIVGELNQLAGKSFEAAVEYVRQRVQDLNLARAIVATYRGSIVETQSVYRTNEVTLNWDDGKIHVAANFHNYIEAAYGSATDTPPRPTQAAPVQTSTAKPNPNLVGSDAWFADVLKRQSSS